MGLFAHANQERPILLDQADHPVTRHIGGGEDADDTGHGRRSASVDAENFGPWVVTKLERTIDHAIQLHIGDIGALAQNHPASIIARVTCADFSCTGRLGNLFFSANSIGGIENGVDDLFVASAAAEMRRQRFGDIVTRGRRVLL